MIIPREALGRSPGVRKLVLFLIPAAAGVAWGVVDRVLDQLGMKPRT